MTQEKENKLTESLRKFVVNFCENCYTQPIDVWIAIHHEASERINKELRKQN